MKPYYKDDYCTIYHGDCREVLPMLSNVDLVLTDPPYGIGAAKGSIGKKRAHKINYTTKCDTPDYVEIVVVPVIRQLLTISKAVILTPGTKHLMLYPQPDSFGCMYQPATCGMQAWGRADAQPILYYGKDPRVGKTISFCSFQVTEKPEANGHPCPKPLNFWKQLIMKGSLDRAMILDPFMGSGTTLIAAKNLGRNAIGIEIEEKYCEVAVKRLAQEIFPI